MSVYAEVKRAYTEKTRKLQFVASRSVKASGVLAILKAIGQYNQFRPAKVATAINVVDPNAKVYVGRDYSPVLYIKTTSARESRMRSALRAAKADEIGKHRGWIRAWWD